MSEDSKAVAIYNADKKELVAIIGSMQLATKFIYGKYTNAKKYQNVHYAIAKKGRLVKNDLGFVVACRNGNKEQVDMLGDKDYIIFDDALLSKMTFDMLMKFNTSADSLSHRHATECFTSHPALKCNLNKKGKGASKFAYTQLGDKNSSLTNS